MIGEPDLHIPVMLAEVVQILQPAPGGRYIDCTLGSGGHSSSILALSSPDGRLLGLDADPEALGIARLTLGDLTERAILIHSNFEHLAQVARSNGFENVDGILLDLGLSSRQLGQSGRGFAFRHSEPLDMRLDPTEGASAAELLSSSTESEIESILREYGEERAARRIARSIVYHRERGGMRTTDDLVGAVLSAIGGRHARVHPATRTFQAVRIAVNRELEILEETLQAAIQLLRPAGRIVVISFHSLEDRIVKLAFRKLEAQDAPVRIRILTKKPLTPSSAERTANPRARSAKLRAAERAQDAGKESPSWPR